MAFSTATVTHTYTNADGTPASGNLKFSLTSSMTNGTTTIVPTTITAALNASGVLSQSLTSNVDPATWTLSTSASGGSFSLALAGTPNGTQTTASLNWNASSAMIQTALNALSGLQTMTCSGGPLGSGTVTINGITGNLVLTATSALTGGSLTVTQTATGTIPAAPLNTKWRVDTAILGAIQETYYIVVPTGGGSVDLGSLLPTNQQVG